MRIALVPVAKANANAPQQSANVTVIVVVANQKLLIMQRKKAVVNP